MCWVRYSGSKCAWNFPTGCLGKDGTLAARGTRGETAEDAGRGQVDGQCKDPPLLLSLGPPFKNVGKLLNSWNYWYIWVYGWRGGDTWLAPQALEHMPRQDCTGSKTGQGTQASDSPGVHRTLETRVLDPPAWNQAHFPKSPTGRKDPSDSWIMKVNEDSESFPCYSGSFQTLSTN